VYAGDPEGFPERTRSAFADLGETVASALRVVETRRWLSAGCALEVDLAVESPTCPLARLADHLGTDLVHEGTVPDAGDGSRAFLETESAEPEAVRDAAEEVGVADCLGLGTLGREGGRYEVALSAPTVATALGERGCRIDSLSADPSGVEARVRLAASASVRDLVEDLEAAYGSVTMEARREQGVEACTEAGFRASTRERLTDRQWEVLRTAYLRGFFEWPRETTGEEVADALGVSQPSVNRHLRVGERKLLDLLFDP